MKVNNRALSLFYFKKTTTWKEQQNSSNNQRQTLLVWADSQHSSNRRKTTTLQEECNKLNVESKIHKKNATSRNSKREQNCNTPTTTLLQLPTRLASRHNTTSQEQTQTVNNATKINYKRGRLIATAKIGAGDELVWIWVFNGIMVVWYCIFVLVPVKKHRKPVHTGYTHFRPRC